MASGAAADGVFWSVYEGCISGYDNRVERRPYHRKCRCALHNKKSPINCTHKLPRCNTVSYPIKRSWSEGNLVVRSASPDSSSPSLPESRSHRSLVNLVEEELEEEEENDK